MTSKYEGLYQAVSLVRLDFFSSATGRPSYTDAASNGDRIFKYYSNMKTYSLDVRKRQAAEFYECIKHVPGVKKVVVRNAAVSWDDYDKICVYVNIPK